MKFTKSDYETFEKRKIGELAKPLITIILEKNLISKIEIENLQKAEYSKSIFNVNYPILKKNNKNLSLKENIEFNGGNRYYVEPIKNGENEFFITNHWYDYHKEDFIIWLKRKVTDL